VHGSLLNRLMFCCQCQHGRPRAGAPGTCPLEMLQSVLCISSYSELRPVLRVTTGSYSDSVFIHIIKQE